MVDPRSPETIRAFAKSVGDIADIIQKENPATLLIPLKGAVPLIDVLSIMDSAVLDREHEYIPASSSMVDVKHILYSWMRNYLEETHIAGTQQYLLSLDEVKSGNSAMRVWKQVNRAIADHAREHKLEKEEFVYRTVGLEDQRHFTERKKEYNDAYLRMKKEGIIISVPVPMIITMDRPELCPINLVNIPGERAHKALPVMQTFAMTPEYLQLLESICSIVGRDFADVEFQRVGAIRASEHYLPEKYTSLESYLQAKS